MSESYVVDGVTITPQNGGYYLLIHDSLADAEKVRGKEAADARAKEIAAASVPADGSMQPQPPLDEIVIPPAAPAAPDAAVDIAALQALVAKQSAMLEQLLTAQSTTVLTNGADPVDNSRLVAREFTGQVDARTRKLAAAAGIEYVTIILEEGNDIPPTGLFISHNGNSYMICPGETVDVPDFLLGVLDDAIMSSPVVDSKSQKVLGYRDRMKYPYRRV